MSDERKLVIGVGAFLLAVACLVFALVYRTEANATVTRRTWQRAINIERWQTVEESDWSVPQGGRMERAYSAYHHSITVVSGYITSCTGKPLICTRTPIFTSIPVYETKYDYLIERWVIVRTPVKNGVDNEPAWPDVSDLKTSAVLTIGDERAGMQTSRYTVDFTDGYSLDLTEERWQAFRPGQHVTLILNLFKQAMDVKGLLR